MEAEQIKGLKSGDEKSVSDFFENYKKPIFLTAYRITGNKEDALDITQDAFIKILSKINNISEDKLVDAYIHRIVANCAYDYLREKYKPNKLREIVQFFTKKQKTPAESYKREELREKVLRAINKLSKGEKTIIIMKYFQDLKIREIADTLEVSEGTIKKQMDRAKGKLEKILRKDIR